VKFHARYIFNNVNRRAYARACQNSSQRLAFGTLILGRGLILKNSQKQPLFNTKKLVSKTLVFETAKLKRRAASFDARGFLERRSL
jgi:hypothetical protein